MLLAVNVFLLLVFLFSYYQGYFHSDSSVRNLLAQEMHDSGSFFPPDWNYVNKDLMVVFPHLIVWGLLFFFDNSYTLFAVAGVITALLILGSVWWFTSLLGDVSWQRILSLAVLAGGISITFAEDMFGQAAYGVLLALTCLLMVLGWRSMTSMRNQRLVWWVLLFGLVTLVTWSNPQRAAASYLLPLYCGLAAYLWGERWKERMLAMSPVLAITVAGFVAGFGISLWSLDHVNNNAGAGAARWLDFNGMARNALQTLHGLMGLLGALPVANGDVISRSGIYAALRLVAGLVVLMLIGRRVVLLCSSRAPQMRFVGGVVAGLALCFVFLQITTTVPDMDNPLVSARYLTPALVLGLVVLFCSPLKHASWLEATLIIGLGVLLASNSVVSINPNSLVNPGWKNPQREAMIDELKTMGLHYGYASYWNAGALTVLGRNEVKVRQILIPKGLPLPMRHLSSDNWYEPEAWAGETFLLLTDAEVAAVDWGALTRYAGQPVREAKVQGMRVFVFKDNLSANLPGWSVRLHGPHHIRAMPNGMKTVGHWLDAESALQTRKDESGYLQFGPYMQLGRGHYRASFDVSGKAESAAQIVATVDVVAAGGGQVLGALPVMANGQSEYAIDFSLKQPVQNLELRVTSNGAGEVIYKGVTLSPIP
ncbi:hypothetical protein A7D17_05220 [Xanthomonas floridensis]|uniref:Glycosyltransferase RgtA/B/C/D-like domain-containing protein n=1 Tax=Xanthomonas floridensis TaxID=1843580 RepID=A0A1A9M7N2_9XANT|nr:hypothetical protein A7D17_05220 [Xanthomonas floridensis]